MPNLMSKLLLVEKCCHVKHDGNRVLCYLDLADNLSSFVIKR